MEDFETFFISEEEAGERFDKVLALRLKHAGSRSYFQYLIDEGRVLLNGTPVKKRIKPHAGDEVEVEYALTPELTLKPENIPLNVLYEDDSILVIDKEPGMVVHPATGNWTGTFVNALLYHCRELQELGLSDLRPGIVHRLDKETSGLLIAAKTSIAQKRLIEIFSNRQVHKEYLAVCCGNPGFGTINAPIGRHPVNRKLMAIREEGGRVAITHFKTLVYDEKLCVVNVIIATGRTHQIRVHMKHRGAPVLGDKAYGVPSLNAKFGAERPLLHAWKLGFAHPLTGESLQFEAPIPQDIQHFMNRISKR